MNLEELRENIRTNRQWCEQAIKIIYMMQTSDEQESASTVSRNNVGFNAHDAPFMSSLALSLKRYPHLTERQLASAQKIMPKYAKQLLELGKGNMGDENKRDENKRDKNKRDKKGNEMQASLWVGSGNDG